MLKNLNKQESIFWREQMCFYKKAAVFAVKKIDKYNKSLEEPIIEHIKYRIKTEKSIEGKLAKRGMVVSIENALGLKDIAGIRLVCLFESDIYNIVKAIKNVLAFDVVLEKDYVKNPKKSGYRGYHILINVDIKGKIIPVEIQIRSLSMDFWACIEHKLVYKPNFKKRKKIQKSLEKASEQISQIEKTLCQ